LKLDKEQILNELYAGITTVSFTKVNGDRRDMNCTLNKAYIPAKRADASNKVRKENPEVQAVWDTDKKAWRSFRWNSILKD